MGLRLYDFGTRDVRDFVPVIPGEAGIYICGPTPQSGPHLGHLRAAIAFDVLRRWLERTGHRVTLIRNVTDIDDKILDKAATAGRSWWAHAYLFEREFSAAYEVVNVLPPTYEPRATGHVTDMVDLIHRLINAGHAYPAPDGSGDVYFDVRSFPAYGALTRQSIEDMEPAADADPRGKRDPRDFALWKGAKPGEPVSASWPTPWGSGRPGWHLECSAMVTRYLGPEFDIHGGGIDLRFPHHENELAQSRAVGDGFARYWMHNGWVVAAGEKMSKSLGNTLSLSAVLERARPAVVRYLLTAAHYRSNIEVGEDSLDAAAAAYERVAGFVARAIDVLGEAAASRERLATLPLCAEFTTAMDDDLGVPAALAAVHETVRQGNTALDSGEAEVALGAVLAVRAMLDVLGLDPLDPRWSGPEHGDARVAAALDALVRAELDARAEARKERDFAAADAIRDRLAAAGIAVEDTADGARWSVRSGPDGR